MATQYEIVDLIGPEKYRRLALRKSGERLYIPARLKPDCELVQLVGWGAAKVLSEFLGNEVVHISRAVVLRERNRQITAMRLSGIPAERIGKIFGLRARTIRVISQSVEPEDYKFFGSSARRMRWFDQPKPSQLPLGF